MNKYYILQSLREHDRKTGRELFDTLKNKCDIFFQEYHSKNELKSILEYISIDTQISNSIPFVHFDCHGDENGVGVVKSDFTEEDITWNELGDQFREIYITSSKRSVLCFSSCEGFNSSKLVPQFKVCPFSYVAGSFEKITFNDSLNGYRDFYEQIISGIDIKQAAYHVHQKYSDLKFLCFSAEVLFEVASTSYLKEKTTLEELQKRKENFESVLQLNNAQRAFLNYVYTQQGQQEFINKWKRVFFA
ncbi:hypothetical protein [Spirosoma sp. KUDC1026]|uniref:hypothetical protein n=1 Tax=Spirosoma sp. KUDC1026 TaxID=2745947 RepID=UPI00159BA40A|nr:hypothetical protein [Spirosoma sp. KUDC1026]QKZ14191.1 hypothetical protein HU175_16775 [Spirosoma sp. KUDC1026]